MKRQIDRFKLLEPLAEGGGGAVYRAEEMLAPNVTRLVALKLLPAITPKDKSSERRFAGELAALAAMTGHPHTVALYGAGIADSAPWIATELLPQSLVEIIGESPADPAEVARMIRHVGRALATMHSMQPPMLHNDLKPANIMLDVCSNYKVADFGTACPEGAERTRVVATVRYAAPELLSRDFGPTGPATDLYALGHIAYEMALGGKIYRKQFPSVYDEHDQSKDAPPARWMAWHCSLRSVAAPLQEVRPGFPPALSDLIAKLMAKDPAQRASSAAAMLEELKALSTAQAPAPQPMIEEIPLEPAPSRGSTAPAGRASAAPAPPPIPQRKFVPSQARPAPGAASIGAGATAAGAKFWVKLRGQITGPFDLAALQRQAKQGRISRLHQVSTDRATWQSATTVEGLF